MTPTLAVLAVDPGKKTGLAFHSYENSLRMITETKEFLERDFDETCAFIMQTAEIYEEDLLLVSESFTITVNTAKNTQAPWSLELIGFMRYVSRRYTGRDLTLQQPSAAKRFSSDLRLRSLGYWTTGLAGHANDAARHLLLAEATRGYLGTDTLKDLAQLS